MAYGPKAKSGKPYSDEQNYTIVVGLEGDFRELVMGKAQKPAVVEPAPCPEGGAPKIDVISVSVPPAQSETLAPLRQQGAELAEGLERGNAARKASTRDAKALETETGEARTGQKSEIRVHLEERHKLPDLLQL